MITSVRPEVSSDYQGYDYFITQKLMEVGPSVDVVMPGKFMQLNHRHNPHTTDISGSPTIETPTSSTKTISETAVQFYNTTGAYISSVYHGGDQPTQDECVAYIINPLGGKMVSPSWSQMTIPGGCFTVPPSDEWCKITTPELVLDHGTITLKQAEGSTATTQMDVKCTTATAVQFNMITSDKYIYLDEGKSEVTVNNLPLKTKIDLPQGDSSLPVKDLLTGITTEGFHTGSSVLVMMPY